MKAAISMIIITLLLLAVLSQVAGQESSTEADVQTKTRQPRDFSFWMDVKLSESQKLFAALAKADFEALITSSETLESLNAVEGFVRRRTPGYRTQLRAFEFAVDEIKRQAKQEDIEGVTLGFQQLTLSCVNCHKQIREAATRTK